MQPTLGLARDLRLGCVNSVIANHDSCTLYCMALYPVLQNSDDVAKVTLAYSSREEEEGN